MVGFGGPLGGPRHLLLPVLHGQSEDDGNIPPEVLCDGFSYLHPHLPVLFECSSNFGGPVAGQGGRSVRIALFQSYDNRPNPKHTVYRTRKIFVSAGMALIGIKASLISLENLEFKEALDISYLKQ